MEIQRVLEKANEVAVENQVIILVTILDAKGSTPRDKGALMAVGEEGIIAGTIGGGKLEYHCEQLAKTYTQDPQGGIESFVLNNQEAGSLGMTCGGTTKVLFNYIKTSGLLGQMCYQLAQYDTQYGTQNVPMLFLPLDGSEPHIQEVTSTEYHVEGYLQLPIVSAQKIYLCGAGHVAYETAKLLDQLDFPYIVIDERQEFANKERFPHALAIYHIPYEQLEEAMQEGSYLQPNPQDGFCIMTRGHAGDIEVVRYVLQTDVSYIGMMGSRRKREQVFQKLESEGWTSVRERVKSPIGIEIQAQSPVELAISVAAELIQWRASQA